MKATFFMLAFASALACALCNCKFNDCMTCVSNKCSYFVKRGNYFCDNKNAHHLHVLYKASKKGHCIIAEGMKRQHFGSSLIPVGSTASPGFGDSTVIGIPDHEVRATSNPSDILITAQNKEPTRQPILSTTVVAFESTAQVIPFSSVFPQSAVGTENTAFLSTLSPETTTHSIHFSTTVYPQSSVSPENIPSSSTVSPVTTTQGIPLSTTESTVTAQSNLFPTTVTEQSTQSTTSVPPVKKIHTNQSTPVTTEKPPDPTTTDKYLNYPKAAFVIINDFEPTHENKQGGSTSVSMTVPMTSIASSVDRETTVSPPYEMEKNQSNQANARKILTTVIPSEKSTVLPTDRGSGQTDEPSNGSFVDDKHNEQNVNKPSKDDLGQGESEKIPTGIQSDRTVSSKKPNVQGNTPSTSIQIKGNVFDRSNEQDSSSSQKKPKLSVVWKGSSYASSTIPFVASVVVLFIVICSLYPLSRVSLGRRRINSNNEEIELVEIQTNESVL